MTDRNGAFGSSAAPGGRWRVAVGGNRVENMTPEQIAEGYRRGQLTERTPLWPPGTSGWQALGNFSQFQSAAPQTQAQLSSYDEDEDDPTRMWTGPGDLDGFSPSGMPGGYAAPPAPAPPAPAPPAAAAAPPGPPPTPPPAARPAPAQHGYPPAPAMSHPPQRLTPGPSSSSVAFQPQARRGSGVPVVVGLLGLLGLGAALFAARGDLGEDQSKTAQAAVAAQPAPEPTKTKAAQGKAEAAPASDESTAGGSAKLAKFESGAVAEVKTSKLEPAEAKAEDGDEDERSDEKSSEESDDESATLDVEKKAKRQAISSSKKKKRKRWSRSKARKRRKKAASRRKARRSRKARSTPKAKAASKPSSASATPQSTNDAARAALERSSKLASSCRPRGGPSGNGRARIVYAQDGSVQNVEILTARFRDTVTGNCVRMVFRRAQIPAFRGSAPTFIKSFTIPEN